MFIVIFSSATSQASSYTSCVSEPFDLESVLSGYDLKQWNRTLDRTTLISMLYLGLLLSKSEAQLGDLMRFVVAYLN